MIVVYFYGEDRPTTDIRYVSTHVTKPALLEKLDLLDR